MTLEQVLHQFFETNVDQSRLKRTKTCADMLSILKDGVFRERWKGGWKPKHKGTWEKEETAIVSMLIRLSGELPNYRKNVDFITREVKASIEKEVKGKQVGVWSKDFHHEHMVPGSQSILLITRGDDPIEDTLASINYRALVTKDEQKILNKNGLKTGVPEANDVNGWKGKPEPVPVEFYCLFRYDVAGILNDLIPVSERAQNLLLAYRQFRDKHIGGGKLSRIGSADEVRCGGMIPAVSGIIRT